jgi:GT2 family glycosyltransferase
MEKMKLHILTLHWNAKNKIERLYKSLIPSLDGIDFKWWIKDNNSIDGSVEYLKSIESENIEVYYCSHNRDSFSIGMNILFNRVNPNDDDFILLLNNDLWFGDTKSIKNMISLFKKDVGIVGSRILYPDSNNLQHGGVYFSKKYNCLPYHYRHNLPSTISDEKNKEVESVTGALLLTKAEYYRKICENKNRRFGLDEKFFWAFEDIDANLAIKYNLGKKIIYCGENLVYHEESASLKKNPVNKMMMPQNVARFKEKWWGKYKIEE